MPSRKAPKKRIRLKFDVSRLANYLLIPVATLLIVSIGVFIPVLLLKGRADPKRLPAGYADIGDIMPYGAAYKTNEELIVNGLNEYQLFRSKFGSMINIHDYPCRDIASYTDRYDQIGTPGAGNEFVFDYTEMISYYFSSDLEEHNEFEVRDLSENTVLVGDMYGYGDGFVLLRDHGLPLYSTMHIKSSVEYVDMREIFQKLAEMYNEYSGLDFTVEVFNSDPWADEMTASCVMLTSDSALRLDVGVSRLKYYAYGDDDMADGDPYYVYIIDFSVTTTMASDYDLISVG